MTLEKKHSQAPYIYTLCGTNYVYTKAENETCITYVILHQSAVKRSCCMSRPQLHLDTQTDKFVFVNSIHWYLLQNQNCMSHRSKCFWWRALDWTPTAMIKIRISSMTDVYKKGVLVSIAIPPETLYFLWLEVPSCLVCLHNLGTH